MSFLRQLPPILAGIFAGLGGAYLFGKTPVATSAAAGVPVRADVAGPTFVVQHITAPAGEVPAPSAASPSSVPEAPPPDPQQARRDVEEQSARDFAQHARDARDSAWAAKSEASIGETLRANAGDREVVGVECRMTSCVASLAWPTRLSAQNDYRNLLIASYEPNCTTRIILPPASDPEARYDARLFFDCTDARARGIER